MLSNELHIEDALTRKELLDKWTSLEDPRPTWKSYEKLIGMTSIDVDKVLELWKRKVPTVPIKK